jgi:hypothetical protein
VFRNPISNLQELQQAKQDTKANVGLEMLTNFLNILKRRLRYCL